MAAPHPGDRPPTSRPPDLHTVWQTSDLAHIDDQPAAPQRGIRRPGLLQPHRDGSRSRHEERPPTSPATGRRMGDHPNPADHRGTDVRRCEQDHDGQHEMESTPRRTRPVAAERSCPVRCLRSRHQRPPDARGRNGSWHRYYYCRNHDPIRAGGADRRCPERNIRAEALDDYVFNRIRTALLHPDTLLAGEQAVAARTPTPDDELLSTELT